MKLEKINILGAFVHRITMDEALLTIKEKLELQEKAQIVTINPEMIMEAQNNPDFLNTINNSDLVVPDGHGVVWAAEQLGVKIKERVPGIELMEEMLSLAENNQKSVYFYGAEEIVIHKSVEVIQDRFPKLNVVGCCHGYVQGASLDELEKQLIKLQPDLLFIGLGAPKQELYGASILKELTHTIVMGVGGSFDVISGNVKRAPVFFQKIHMEWLYRGIVDKKRRKRLLVIPKYMKQVKKIAKEKNKASK